MAYWQAFGALSPVSPQREFRHGDHQSIFAPGAAPIARSASTVLPMALMPLGRSVEDTAQRHGGDAARSRDRAVIFPTPSAPPPRSPDRP
jgi:hypothetical protein